MEIKKLSDCVNFSDEKMQKVPIFESERFFFDHYCLLPGQSQKVHSHALEDKVYVVIEGTGTFTIGDEVRELSAGEAVIARATVPHGVSNTSSERLICLVTMSPRPISK